jgi:hypothetical protein
MPLIPPYASIGYDSSASANVIGISGLPLGYIGSGDLSVTVSISAATTAKEITFTSTTQSGVTLTVSGSASLQAGDIILLYNDANKQNLHLTYKSGGTVLVPAIPYPINSGVHSFSFESVFRPVSSLVLDSSNALATATTSASFTAVTTWDHLNRLTNYSMVRPVNRYSMAKNPIHTAQLKLNGRERFQTRPGEYFNWVQCKEHHTNIPHSPGINVYSFAINPEDHQPSGTCNFSRLDSARLVLKLRPLYYGVTGIGNSTDGTIQTGSRSVPINIYAVNYNILRIMSGMGGVAYSS